MFDKQIDKILSIAAKYDGEPILKTTINPTFFWKPRGVYGHLPAEVCFTNTNAEIHLSGKFAIIQSGWLGHIGHNTHDSLGMFEYIRTHTKNVKFIITEYAKDMHQTTLEQLKLLHPYYADNCVFVPRDVNTSITGTLYQLEALQDWKHHAYQYGSFLQNRLKQLTNDECETKREHIVFCPRIPTNASNGRNNTEEQIHDIKQMLAEYKHVDVSVFHHIDENGKVLTIEQQKNIFESATILVGVHGTAMANMLWSHRLGNFDLPPLNVIEITGCPPEDKPMSHWQFFSKHHNVSWKTIFYNLSDPTYVRVPINNLKQAIDDCLIHDNRHF